MYGCADLKVAEFARLPEQGTIAHLLHDEHMTVKREMNMHNRCADCAGQASVNIVVQNVRSLQHGRQRGESHA